MKRHEKIEKTRKRNVPPTMTKIKIESFQERLGRYCLKGQDMSEQWKFILKNDRRRETC